MEFPNQEATQPSQAGTDESQVTSSTPDTGQTPPAAPDAAAPDQSQSPTLGADGQPVAPAYTPNLKYKVLDQEKAIPDFLKDVIKDADTEKKVKELFEKADGLDIVKPKYQETRQQLKQVSEQFQSMQTQIGDLRQDYARGDFDSFFKKLQIPEEKVLNWMVEKIRYNQLPEEQRRILDERKSAQQQVLEKERSLSATEQAYMQQLSSAKGELLELSLERAEIKGFADQFDSRFGQAGAFRNAVVNVGQAAWDRGIDLSPQQAIKQVMDHYGKLIVGGQAAAPASQGGVQPTPTTPPAARPNDPPVIPNVGGRQSSPTSSKPKSLADIRKLAQSM